MKLNVAGMVTLYNSERDVLQRIGTYIDQVDIVYAVDNSEQADPALIDAIQKQYPTVRYISNQGNKGIAHALNVAARTAISDRFGYLLMMDDDSEAPANIVTTLLMCLIDPKPPKWASYQRNQMTAFIVMLNRKLTQPSHPGVC